MHKRVLSAAQLANSTLSGRPVLNNRPHAQAFVYSSPANSAQHTLSGRSIPKLPAINPKGYVRLGTLSGQSNIPKLPALNPSAHSPVNPKASRSQPKRVYSASAHSDIDRSRESLATVEKLVLLVAVAFSGGVVVRWWTTKTRRVMAAGHTRHNRGRQCIMAAAHEHLTNMLRTRRAGAEFHPLRRIERIDSHRQLAHFGFGEGRVGETFPGGSRNLLLALGLLALGLVAAASWLLDMRLSVIRRAIPLQIENEPQSSARIPFKPVRCALVPNFLVMYEMAKEAATHELVILRVQEEGVPMFIAL